MQFATPAEREAFIVANKGIVMDVIRKTRLGNFSKDDAVSIGMLELIRVVDTYESGRVAFSTFAYRAVKFAIWHEVNCTTSFGRVPKHTFDNAVKCDKGESITQSQMECVNAFRRIRGTSEVMPDDAVAPDSGYWERVERQCRELVIATNELDEPSRKIMMERLGIGRGFKVKPWREVAMAVGKSRSAIQSSVSGALDYLRDRVASVA